MEQSQNMKTISAIIVVLLILGASYLLFGKNRSPNQDYLPVSDSALDESSAVVVENTPVVNGALGMPAGFPPDIPLESDGITESATTYYPEQNARQLSASYRSVRTVTQKYTEYRNYMNQAGYDVTEGDTNAPVRAIFGTREDVNLSVFISSSEGRTLVQISYLIK